MQRYKTSPLVTSEIQNALNGDSSSLEENKENDQGKIPKVRVLQKKKRTKKMNVPMLSLSKSFEKFDEIRRKRMVRAHRNARHYLAGFQNCCPLCPRHENNGSLPDLSKVPATDPYMDQMLSPDSKDSDSGFSNPRSPFSPNMHGQFFKV